MNQCFCEPNFPKIRVESIAIADGVATLTIPTTAVINDGDIVDVQLFTSIPDGTDGAEIIISNGGTVASPVMNGNGKYLRLSPITSRTILRVQYLSDPDHFQILWIFNSRMRRFK